MINIRKTLLAVAVFAAAAAPLSAQVYRTTITPRGWLGISYDETVVIHDRERSGAVTITDVAKGSPAERAGVQVGDTLVRVNDFRATSDVLRSMGAALQPGDTVHFIVRRGGRDRNLAIEVAKRPPEAQTYVQGRNGVNIYTYDPDSVRGMMKLFIDSMYAGLDTARMRRFRIDTAGGFRGLIADSMFFGTMPMTVFQHADSLARLLPGHMFSDTFARTLPRAGGGVMPPMVYDSRVPDVVFRSFARGASAFAGADLTDLNPDLGEYFGTKAGVLVLDVPEGTPAARAGLEPGDIVTRVDGTVVNNVVELRRVVEKARRGAPIKLDVMRHQKLHSVELKRD